MKAIKSVGGGQWVDKDNNVVFPKILDDTKSEKVKKKPKKKSKDKIVKEMKYIKPFKIFNK
jgi:hypothetical protein